MFAPACLVLRIEAEGACKRDFLSFLRTGSVARLDQLQGGKSKVGYPFPKGFVPWLNRRPPLGITASAPGWEQARWEKSGAPSIRG